jgi:DNA-binding MarR family transcriptional regulator
MLVEVNRSVGKAIRSLNNMIARRFDAGGPDREVLERITCGNRWVIGYLVEQTQAGREVYQRDLEKTFGITRSTVSKVLDLMVRKGLIERQSVAHDARLKKLVLLPKALELSAQMRAYAESVERELLTGFSPEEVERLFGYIDRMKKNLGEA